MSKRDWAMFRCDADLRQDTAELQMQLETHVNFRLLELEARSMA